MSSHAGRLKARHSGMLFISSCTPLRKALGLAGVTPLDDAWVAKAMEAAVLGLPPGTSPFRINLMRAVGRYEDEWKVFSYDKYIATAAQSIRNGVPAYGAPIPDEIAERVRRIDMVVWTQGNRSPCAAARRSVR